MGPRHLPDGLLALGQAVEIAHAARVGAAPRLVESSLFVLNCLHARRNLERRPECRLACPCKVSWRQGGQREIDGEMRQSTRTRPGIACLDSRTEFPNFDDRRPDDVPTLRE